MANTIEKDLLNKYMSQSDLIGTLGLNSIKGLITSAILVYAFIKFMELLGYGAMPFAHIAIFLTLTFGIYYRYFWKASGESNDPEIPYTYGNTWGCRSIPRTWVDFFYTTKLDVEYTYFLATSWICAAGIYIGLLVVAYIGSYSLDNSGSPVVMSVIKTVTIGLLATGGYIYGQRYELRKDFWNTILKCFGFGFAVSISTYALGVAIGICILVFGLPITLAVVILEIGFTALYTYMDLVTWSKDTHTRLVKEEEETKLKEEKKLAEEKKLEEESKVDNL